MKLEAASCIDFLPHDHSSYKVSRIAAMARADTLFGGARALVVARKCTKWDALSVVKDVYSRSTGRHSAEHEGWNCPECGQVHLGQDSALACCVMEAFDH
jgi:hypothetical protein